MNEMFSMMASNWWNKIVNYITGFFAMIPQIIYFLYACAASLLDFLQYLIRKLAGLDVYYVEGEAVEGDIVISFIKGIVGIDTDARYSSLTTVFWSLVVFGCMLLVLTTIFSIIKAHYNYDAKKSHPFTIIGSSLKSLALMAIVPLVAIFGLYLSEVILSALDSATANTSTGITTFKGAVTTTTGENGETVQVSEFKNVFQAGYAKTKTKESEESTDEERGDLVYGSYDFFGSRNYTSNVTFSGVMFQTAAYECNRVRLGDYTAPTSKEGAINSNVGSSIITLITDRDSNPKKWENFDVFFSTTENVDDRKEEVASQIDYAFANCLTLKESKTINYTDGEEENTVMATTLNNPYGAAISCALINVKYFSKYNIALVWYYYNLWAFNFFIGFAGITAFLVILGNITFGMITRLIQLLALFFVFPPLVGIAPLDEGNSFKAWRKQYISDVLMAYGAVIGMNLFFLILPFLNTISFFNQVILDNLMNVVIMLAGMTMIGKLISMLSSFIGGGDANKVGQETREATTALASKGLQKTMGAATIGVKAFSLGGGGLAGMALKGIGNSSAMKKITSLAAGASQQVRDFKYDKRKGADTYDEIYNKKVADWKSDPANAGKEMSDKDKMVIEDQARKAHDEQFKTGKSALDPTKTVEKSGRYSRRDAKLKAINYALVPFGADWKKDSNGSLDAKRNIKAMGQAVIDVSKLGLTTIGSVTGWNGAYKKMKERGDTDAIKELFQAVGVDRKQHKSFATKKQKEDDEKAKASEERTHVAATSTNIDNINKTLATLLDTIQKM